MNEIPHRQSRRKIIKHTCFTANIVYLGLHVLYLILFLIAQLPTMVYIDIAFIAIYLFCFYVLKKAKYYIFALICGNSFYVFIALATIFLGFNSGFHLIILGMTAVSFFTSYFSVVRDVKNPLIWSGISIILYLVLYFVSKFVAPTYLIPSWLEMTLMTTHILFTFLILVTYLFVFLKFSFFLEARIMNESRTDELTQIHNRYGLYDYLETIDDKINCHLAIFDIDDFKKVNDTYGHVCGDYILKSIAEIATNTIKDNFTCRYGGEEFIIIFKNDIHTSYVFQQLEELRKNIEAYHFEFENKPLHITITIGAAKYTKQTNTTKAWIEQADSKLYDGKQSGKNKTLI